MTMISLKNGCHYSVDSLCRYITTTMGGMEDKEYFFLMAALYGAAQQLKQHADISETLGYSRCSVLLEGLCQLNQVCCDEDPGYAGLILHTFHEVERLTRAYITSIFAQHTPAVRS